MCFSCAVELSDWEHFALLCLVLTACSRCECAPWHPHAEMCVVVGCQSSGQVLCLFSSFSVIRFVLFFSEEAGC